MQEILYPALASELALLVYGWNFVTCARARGKHGIKAPAVTGHPEFERAFRIQQNMIEQLILFLPALWLFSAVISPVIGGLLGMGFVAGRVVYSLAYLADPTRRGPGFGVAALCSLILLLGAILGTLRALF